MRRPECPVRSSCCGASIDAASIESFALRVLIMIVAPVATLVLPCPCRRRRFFYCKYRRLLVLAFGASVSARVMYINSTRTRVSAMTVNSAISRHRKLSTTIHRFSYLTSYHVWLVDLSDKRRRLWLNICCNTLTRDDSAPSRVVNTSAVCSASKRHMP